MMPRILLSSLVVLGSAAAIAAGATGAFFSDTETSTGNIFTAGAIDLKIDNESYYNLNKCDVDTQDFDGDLDVDEYVWQGQAGFPIPGTSCNTSWLPDDLNNGAITLHKFFDFNDVKPDDEGEDTISLHVQNDAWMCMDLTLTTNDDQSSTEPELLVDVADLPDNAWDGELAQNIQMFWWADDGDNVYEQGEPTISGGVKTLLELAPQDTPWKVAIADAGNNIWGDVGQPVPAEVTRYIAKAWCMGTLTPAPLAQLDAGGPQERGTGFLCDGTALGNETQTDVATLDVAFSAVQARHNDDFMCTPLRECELSEEFAIAAHNVDQGRRKNGTAVTVDRTNPAFALGAPQSLGTPYDTPVVPSSFFSLGFKAVPSDATATTTPGGSIVLEFPGNVVQGPGPDLKLWEVTGGTSYPDELVRVEVSNSLAGPWTLVSASITRDGEMELPVASAKYVRITDVSPPAGFEATADGFDLDAVQALNCRIPLVI